MPLLVPLEPTNNDNSLTVNFFFKLVKWLQSKDFYKGFDDDKDNNENNYQVMVIVAM